MVARSWVGWRKPLADRLSVSRMASKSARSRACSSGEIGALFSGVHQLAVRSYTVREATVSTTAGITWTPLEPVPMTATRMPVKSTGSDGHSPVWYDSPRKSSRPGTSGKKGTESTPVAATKQRAPKSAPSPITTDHVPELSSELGER